MLPLIAQSLIAAWLLTFTLSLDDVVISAFLSGPGVDDLAAGDLPQGAARAGPGRQRVGDGRDCGRGCVRNWGSATSSPPGSTAC